MRRLPPKAGCGRRPLRPFDCAASLFAARGVNSTWYHDCLSLVLAGSRTCVSVSGRQYVPSHEALGEFSLVTVDVSPLIGDLWGDCARSLCIEDGHVVETPKDPELAEGIAAEETLHSKLLEIARPDMTFDQVYRAMNEQVKRLGYENLDFLGNLGHSIETGIGDRRFIRAGNHDPIGEAQLFTFEPHIRHVHGRWGFKHENIYRFDGSGRLCEV